VEAEYLLRGRALITLDEQAPEDLDCVGIAEGCISWRGRFVEIEKSLPPSLKVIHQPKALILPGLVDTHGHLMGFGQALLGLDLRGMCSLEEISAVVAAANPEGEWILGSGWDQHLWPVPKLPDHHALTAAQPKRPVLLWRIDEHALWLNAEALRRLNLGQHPDPPGGMILRDVQGSPSGVLLDRAMSLATAQLPRSTARQRRAWITQAAERLRSLGLTGIHAMGMGAAELESCRDLEQSGSLGLRVHSYLHSQDPQNSADIAAGPIEGKLLSIAGLKLFMDGALGSRGAWLKAPYSDAPEQRGLRLLEEAEFRAWVIRGLELGHQLAVHVIGDAAAEATLDLFEQLLSGREPRPPRLEHLSLISEADIQRMAALKIWAAVQPAFLSSDWSWLERRLGPLRARRTYPWRSLIDAGVPIALGSDLPIESPEPMATLRAAISRRDHQGKPEGGFVEEQALNIDEALRGYTSEAAALSGLEGRRGQLKPGFDADLSLLSADPRDLPAERLGEIRPLGSVVAGDWRACSGTELEI